MNPSWMRPSWVVPERDAVLSYVGLRRSVGAIGLALPPVLPLGAAAVFGGSLPSSISGYYYTDMRNVFVGSMCAIGVFLLSYRFGRLDAWLARVAGVSAIGLALSPTTPDGVPSARESAVATLHFAFAVVFFLMLAIFCLVLFTRHRPGWDMTPQKVHRNAVYRICGWAIVVSLVLAALAAWFLDDGVQAQLRPVFWLESVAVWAFGWSWLVKGETLFRDRSDAGGDRSVGERSAGSA